MVKRVVILTGSSCVGKTTLMDSLKDHKKAFLSVAVSMSARKAIDYSTTNEKIINYDAAENDFHYVVSFQRAIADYFAYQFFALSQPDGLIHTSDADVMVIERSLLDPICYWAAFSFKYMMNNMYNHEKTDTNSLLDAYLTTPAALFSAREMFLRDSRTMLLNRLSETVRLTFSYDNDSNRDYCDDLRGHEQIRNELTRFKHKLNLLRNNYIYYLDRWSHFIYSLQNAGIEVKLVYMPANPAIPYNDLGGVRPSKRMSLFMDRVLSEVLEMHRDQTESAVPISYMHVLGPTTMSESIKTFHNHVFS